MEFLDIKLTKDSSLLLHAIHIPFYWRILQKNILFYDFKNPLKNSRNKKSRVYSWIAFFVERKDKGRKPDKNLSLRRLEYMPRNLD